MNELSENHIRKFLNALNNITLIEEIEKLVSRMVSGKISICFPKASSQQENIHFLIDTDKNINLFELSSLTTALKEKLDFDYTVEDEAEIVVQLKNLFSNDKINSVYEDSALLSKANFENMQLFLCKHYPKFFSSSQKENAASSSSASSSSNLTRIEGGGHSLDTDLIAYLKQNALLWSRLVNGLDSCDSTQQNVKREIIRASQSSNTNSPVQAGGK
jgi:hypothetical protein